jgi:hypothetical protein
MSQNNEPEHEELSATELARALAARRRIIEGRCEVCGTPFKGTAKKRYCSHRCAVKAHRAGLAKPQTTKEESNDVR